ncbi:hypothetical protein [Noviherbaspirillum denitrificans]|uniref:hypothetical protein n=1 Tax=Noviherbaspirillum denitrificans TaxID=1968433 RepID=UPI0011322C92|nr:hypothetical protein [Noviherbaspirillum denitrificans]
MQFLVSSTDCRIDDDEGLIHIVHADSVSSAIRAFKLQVCIHDKYVRSYILDGEFGERFWILTAKERQHFEKTGELIATPALFRRRLTNYFANRPDLATAYLDYYFSSNDEQELAPEHYCELAEYLLVTKNEFIKAQALPLDAIPVIHQSRCSTS